MKAGRREVIGKAAVMEAAQNLRDRGYSPECVSDYHIKLGPVNFWPTTGRIMVDERRPEAAKGLEALLEVLAGFSYLRSTSRR